MPGVSHADPAPLYPGWPQPNYVNPERRGWMPAFALTWQAMATVLVLGRIFIRAHKENGSLDVDDLFIFIGWLFSIGLTVVACIDSLWYGMDRHSWDVELSLFVGAALSGWVAQVMFLFSTCCTKLSVLMFYRRLVSGTYSPTWKYLIWTAIGITIVYWISIFVVFTQMCQPLESYWLAYRVDPPYEKHYTCLGDSNALILISGILSVLSDVYAVALPCVMLRAYNLTIPHRQRVALNLIFCLGFLVSGAGIARLYYLWQISNTPDTSWNGFNLFVCSIVECQLAIICACLPALQAFVRRYIHGPIQQRRTLRRRRRSNLGDRVESYGLTGPRCSSLHSHQSMHIDDKHSNELAPRPGPESTMKIFLEPKDTIS